jgi:DNA polymerase III sliding clamp (beta) subunit (PCNA family)
MKLKTNELKKFVKSIKNAKFYNFIRIKNNQQGIVFAYENQDYLLEYKIDYNYNLDAFVSVDSFSKIIKSIRQKEINIEFFTDYLTIDNFKILFENNNDFIEKAKSLAERNIENLDYKNLFEIQSDKLSDILSKLQPAISQDPSRYHLNFINIRKQGDKMLFESTDGHKLFQIKTELNQEFSGANIYKDYVSLLLNILEKDKIAKCFQFEEYMKIENDNFAIYYPVGDCEFPPANRLIKYSFRGFTKVSRKILIDILKEALSAIIDDKNNVIALDIFKNKLTCQVIRGETIIYSREIEVESNINLRIGFNAKHLIWTLELFENETVELCFQDALSPLQIQTEDRLAIIMPCQL